MPSAEQAESDRASTQRMIEMEEGLLHEFKIKQSQATGSEELQLTATIVLLTKMISADQDKLAMIGTESRESPNYIRILLGVIVVALFSVVIFVSSND